MTQQSNSDVDRAMAALAAPPMTYRTFATAPPVPVEAAREAAYAGVAAHRVEAENAGAFPLLAAALPDVIEFPRLETPTIGNPAPDKPPAASPEPETQPRMTTTRAGETAQDGPMAQRPEPAPAPEYTLMVTKAPSPRQPAEIGRTPLTAMFRALGATSPSRDDWTQTKPGLQNLLSVL